MKNFFLNLQILKILLVILYYCTFWVSLEHVTLKYIYI